MTYVIAQPCVDVKDRACVDECPVDCIYEGERTLYIHPEECVDCGACEPVCPTEAIFYEDDLPEEWADYLRANVDFFNELERAIRESYPKPKMMILGFPSNPTAQCVELEFFEKVVALAKRYDVLVVHDLAYADIVYDGWKAPSIMQVPGARDVAVEFFTLSKSYNMAGWRIGFMVGNKTLVSALARIKSYHDYGTFTPLQVAAIAALEGDQQCVRDIAEQYKRRRDVLVKGLHEAGWMVEMPKASMYVWAKIPEPYAAMGSLEFAKKLLNEAKVCVSPGIGFGDYGDTHVRFALIENRDRIRQAIRGIKTMFRADGLLPASSKHIHENAE